MILPKRYHYAEAYLTFRCNLNCSYCINKQSGLIMRNELTAEEWIKGINNINFGDIPLTLGGGEPTLHKEFYKIIKGIRKDIRLDLLTNLTFDVEEFIKKVDVKRFSKRDIPIYKPIRVSYHAEKMDAKLLVRRVRILQDAGFGIGIFGLNHPNNTQDNMMISDLCRENNIYFFIKDFLGWYDKQLFGYYRYPQGLDGTKKNCKCKPNILLIAPDGNIFRCHRDLYHNENPVENILTITKIENKFRKCDDYGVCNPCDIKLKTNRFLQMGSSDVEIK